MPQPHSHTESAACLFMRLFTIRSQNRPKLLYRETETNNGHSSSNVCPQSQRVPHLGQDGIVVAHIVVLSSLPRRHKSPLATRCGLNDQDLLLITSSFSASGVDIPAQRGGRLLDRKSLTVAQCSVTNQWSSIRL
ncbi:hypothetical protein RRG08_001536 [Elysia crispata]|uniref:Uncharacterized protein n=1 Tax=Elysia crispata TaxID=231223 RepID=A0AAE1AK04_9GAST|nr:hypothetical protein RRG08_001536 [Elysia crispata]